MPLKEEKIQIKQFLKIFLEKENGIKFYFLKKSKINSDIEYSIPFKTKKKSSPKKIQTIQKIIQQTMDKPWQFKHWSKFIGKEIAESKVYKIPFLNTDDIEIKSPWRVCPIGEHWVRRHPKQLQSWTVTDHDGHCRKNPSKKDFLGGDEMDLMASKKIFLNPKVKASKIDLGICLSLENQNQFDHLISGWTAYWNDIFKLENPLHPNHVKALMATESTFNPKAIATTNPKLIGPARGLMQLTEKTTRLEKNLKTREYRNQYIDLEYEDLWDPNKNIAFGVRHLFRKRETANWILKREPTWFEVLMDYKGKLKSKSRETKNVEIKLEKIFNKLGMPVK
jgi:hypothetical protein